MNQEQRATRALEGQRQCRQKARTNCKHVKKGERVGMVGWRGKDGICIGRRVV